MLLVNDSESCEEALNRHSIWEVNIRDDLQEKKNTKKFKGNCLELSCIKKCHTPPCCSLIACLYTQVNTWIHKSLHTWVYSTKHLFIFESPSGMTSLWYYLGYFLSVTKLTEPQKKLYSIFLWLLFWQLNWYLCAKKNHITTENDLSWEILGDVSGFQLKDTGHVWICCRPYMHSIIIAIVTSQ